MKDETTLAICYELETSPFTDNELLFKWGVPPHLKCTHEEYCEKLLREKPTRKIYDKEYKVKRYYIKTVRKFDTTDY